MRKIYSFMLLVVALLTIGSSAFAQQQVNIATATFNGKDGEYTEGWTTTGTGKSNATYICIGKGEDITSPSFNFTTYSSVTIEVKARSYGSLSGSKATIDLSINGNSFGTLDATTKTATSSCGKVTFTPTSDMTNAVLVVTCTNATSAGSTHGAGVNSIIITGTSASTDPYIEAKESITLKYDATSSYINYTIGNATEETLTATSDDSWISNISVADAKVTFNVMPNTGNQRTGTITLKYGDVTKDVKIVQEKFVADYAVLPFSIAAGMTSADIKKIDGVKLSCSNDYSNATHKVKFSSSGQYLQVKTNSRIGACSFSVMGAGGAGNTSFKLSGSADGETWTEIESFAISFATQNEVVVLRTSKEFDENDRFLKFECTKASTGNVNCGLGEVTIQKYALSAGLSISATRVDAQVGDADFTEPVISSSNNYNGAYTYASNNTDVASVDANTGEVTIGSKSGIAVITIETETNNATFSHDVIAYSIFVKKPAPEGCDFYESFDFLYGEGGNDGKWGGFGSTTLLGELDNEGWTTEGTVCSGYQCASLRKNSDNASCVITPAIGKAGNARITFDAEAWTNDSKKINVELIDGGTFAESEEYSISEAGTTATVDLNGTGEFKTFTLNATDVTEATKISFSTTSSANRAFLDEVIVTISKKDDNTTGIKEVGCAVANGMTFNLQGQRISNGKRGIVISNGKKTMVK